MLPLQLAWKFLNEGRVQTLLILAGVTVGVAAYVFITATMQGVQANLLDKTLGSQAHLSVIDDPPPLTPIYRPEDDRRVLRQVVPREPRQDPFDQWQRALTRVESTPGIVAACPILEGSALALRGGAQQGVLLVGAEGPGLSDGAIACASAVATIPMAPSADSLNVGACAAIALHALCSEGVT